MFAGNQVCAGRRRCRLHMDGASGGLLLAVQHLHSTSNPYLRPACVYVPFVPCSVYQQQWDSAALALTRPMSAEHPWEILDGCQEECFVSATVEGREGVGWACSSVSQRHKLRLSIGCCKELQCCVGGMVRGSLMYCSTRASIRLRVIVCVHHPGGLSGCTVVLIVHISHSCLEGGASWCCLACLCVTNYWLWQLADATSLVLWTGGRRTAPVAS